ncbi:NAD(P)H-dependent oxidoreductase [Tardiphaga sp. 813_E8_N1_3]|uniref:NAD(P)H-dependent oxidoreductase n=1 Tax=Tardiphaga sp. 813_E8_N1_3 TaxID=3240760 RepID=UPI003F22B610
MKILHIDSSISGANSVSRKLSKAIVDRLSGGAENIARARRDLAMEPLPYFGPAILTRTAPDHETALAAEVLKEFLDADAVVIGVPMYMQRFREPNVLIYDREMAYRPDLLQKHVDFGKCTSRSERRRRQGAAILARSHLRLPW